MISDLVLVPAEGVPLAGDLVVPGPAQAVVLIAEGAVSSRSSPRDRAVAAVFHRVGLGTLLLDLLTERERREDTRSGRHRFDIPFLARRLVSAIDWLRQRPETAEVPVCLFGAETAAAAVLLAAAERPERVSAVVSRGGRPDLAHDALACVRAPVLFIVGGDDETDMRLGREATEKLKGPSEIHTVPGATHLFQDPRDLGEVATAARDWFVSHLGKEQHSA
ncbi:dienelactone hydrolase family protein [Streptomyces sp. GD-15H]|uniref:dienelactone hydrolase family protein n=1 Tax=Streptomyces sp. GD-15H TaxID=3129112 RepID=UPI0032514D10